MAAVALVLGGIAGTLVPTALVPADDPVLSAAKQSGWTEVQWPFPIDQFGRGKAFRCDAADCGTPLTLYVRAKIGFCNCTTGVADDPELERIGDLELLGGKVAALGDGRPIAVAWMKGRSRAYALADAESARQICIVDWLQRPLRRHCCDRSARARPPGYHRTERDRVSQQPNDHALGRRSRLGFESRKASTARPDGDCTKARLLQWVKSRHRDG